MNFANCKAKCNFLIICFWIKRPLNFENIQGSSLKSSKMICFIQQQHSNSSGWCLSNTNSNSNSFSALLAIPIPIAIIWKMCNSNSLSIAIVYKKQLQNLSKTVIILLKLNMGLFQTTYMLLEAFQPSLRGQKPYMQNRRL